MNFKKLSSWFLLIIIAVGLGCLYYFKWYEYLSFSTLKLYHATLQNWVEQYYLIIVLFYMLLYILFVTLSVPGAAFMTIIGGFLFGPIATLYVVVSATLGAMLLFLAVRTALGEWLTKQVKGWIKKIETEFQENAFNYLLFLRLMPVFPFWVINVVAALLAMRLKTFLSATFIGIIPGAFVYVMVGNGLDVLFKENKLPNPDIIFTLPILLPLLGLAMLVLIPVIYNQWKRKHTKARIIR
ncbi:MAG: hypothetical protein ACD_45C00008G0005 [uncultured bacterium]|nr:MAG: hypothetical protein ACD_45C00008G0005 [uncultured bacterium]